MKSVKLATYGLFKYTPAKNAVRCLRKNHLWFSRAAALNDPLETRFTPETAEQFTNVVRSGFARVEEMTGEEPSTWEPEIGQDFLEINARENAVLAEHCREMGILSLGQEPDHQAMWAYYAADGHGLCFELEVDEHYLDAHNLILTNVKYGVDLRPHNRAEDMVEVMLEIAEDNPDAKRADIWKALLSVDGRRSFGSRTQVRAASRKHKHWEHEREMRLLHPGWGDRAPLRDVLKAVHVMKKGDDFLDACLDLMRFQYADVPMFRWRFDEANMHMVRSDFVNDGRWS